MEVGRVSGSFILSPRSKRRLFIASGTLSRGGDSSPGRSGVAHTCPYRSKLSRSSPCSRLLPTALPTRLRARLISLQSLEINEMGRRIVSSGCHPAKWKNDNFATLRRLSPDGEELDRGKAHFVRQSIRDALLDGFVILLSRII
ncbi:unnamed protein product [Spirodela intermedia]|uniref:Uncharacterized protein n=1 Tax=Spirodela intermedia TaxID=51605 RepID=A0A7I8JTP5_SPIIN|nr:unnamed protein product [Spirodela intermedia]CAA6673145.1 unnamed protein product [Spirodela intermedia]